MTHRRSPYPPEAPIAVFRGWHVEIAPFLDVITFPRTEEQVGDVHGWLLDTPEGARICARAGAAHARGGRGDCMGAVVSATRCRRWHEIRRLERRLRYAWGTLRARLLRRWTRFVGGAA